MKKNFRKIFVCSIGLVLILLFGFMPCQAQDKIKLKLAHLVPTTHPVHKAATLFKTMVEELTLGKVEITIYPANTFAGNVECIEETMRGSLDMDLTTPGAAQTFIKELAVCMTPFQFSDQGHANRVWNGPALEWVKNILEKNKLIVGAPGIWGFRQMTNNKKIINGPSDLEGLKIRVPPELQLQQLYRACGAVTTTISFSELPMALSQGVADGQCNPMWVFEAFKLYEVQKYVALTDHAYQTMFIFKNKDMWNKLPADVKEAIEISDKVAMDYLHQLTYNTEKKIIDGLKERGLVVSKPNRAEFAEKMGPVHKAIAKYAGKKNFDQWMGYVEAASLR